MYQGPAASLLGGRRTPYPLAKPAAGTSNFGLQATHETSQCDRGHTERTGPGARFAPRALSRLAQGETAELLYWRSLQREALDSAGGLEAATGDVGRCR